MKLIVVVIVGLGLAAIVGVSAGKCSDRECETGTPHYDVRELQCYCVQRPKK